MEKDGVSEETGKSAGACGVPSGLEFSWIARNAFSYPPSATRLAGTPEIIIPEQTCTAKRDFWLVGACVYRVQTKPERDCLGVVIRELLNYQMGEGGERPLPAEEGRWRGK